MAEAGRKSSFLKKRSKKITLSLAALKKEAERMVAATVFLSAARLNITKSFLVLFFKKEHSCLL
jgi:hypothetical protein